MAQGARKRSGARTRLAASVSLYLLVGFVALADPEWAFGVGHARGEPSRFFLALIAICALAMGFVAGVRWRKRSTSRVPSTPLGTFVVFALSAGLHFAGLYVWALVFAFTAMFT